MLCIEALCTGTADGARQIKSVPRENDEENHGGWRGRPDLEAMVAAPVLLASLHAHSPGWQRLPMLVQALRFSLALELLVLRAAPGVAPGTGNPAAHEPANVTRQVSKAAASF